jgi:hypothetical protein
MVQLAGLRLRERRGDWRRGPSIGSGGHVSIYERAEAGAAQQRNPVE